MMDFTEIERKYDDLIIDDKFKEIIDEIINTNHNMFITGSAGTGKSTILKIISDSQFNRSDIILTATTGVASANIYGVTMHSFFKLPIGIITEGETRVTIARINSDYDKAIVIKNMDILVIDEVSMLKPYILETVDTILKVIRQNHDKPFGGVQVLMFGDLFQIEPVVIKGSVEKEYLENEYGGNPFFFSSPIYEIGDFRLHELTKEYRQKDDPKFAEILTRLRTRETEDMLHDDIGYLNKRFVKESDFMSENNFEGIVNIVTTNKKANSINEMCLGVLEKTKKQDSYIFVAERSGKTEKQSSFVEELKILEGCQIMITQNDHSNHVYNGTIGEVVAVDVENQLIIVLPEGRRIPVPVGLGRHDFFEYKYDKQEKKITKNVMGFIKQYPLKLAYAITAHKVQGLTLNKTIVDLGKGAFSCGQTYVALSRVRNLNDMALSVPLKESDFKINKHVKALLEGV